jgi:NADH-quinone oxidoreductase subunit J
VNTAFYISGVVAVIATALAISRLNVVHALLYFIVSLLAVAVVFFTLGAPFAGALVVIINAGAIIVLFVFVVMMLNLGPHAIERERRWLKPYMWFGPTILAIILIAEFNYAINFHSAEVISGKMIEPKEVGLALFTTYSLGVELASMLLLAGLLGAYHLGRRGIDMKGQETSD